MRSAGTRIIAAAAVLCAAALPFHVAGADDAAERARLLAAGCTGCHGTAGQAQAGAAMLAGIDKARFVAEMQAFKSGQRPATVMHQLAKGYTEAEIEAMAAWFATQRR